MTLYKDQVKVFELDVTFNPTCVAIQNEQVSVGTDEGKVYLYKLSSDKLIALSPPLSENKNIVTCLAYSPDSLKLAACDSNRNVLVINLETRIVENEWLFHNARVNCVAWSPSGTRLATGSLDTNIEIWSREKPSKHISIKGAHLEGVNGVGWESETRLVSGGQDGFVKGWDIEHF